MPKAPSAVPEMTLPQAMSAFQAQLAGGDASARALAEEATRAIVQYAADQLPPEAMNEESIMKKHLAYWRYCTKVNCWFEGHRDRARWVIIGPSQRGPFGREQCVEFENVYHAEPLEPIYGAWPLNHPLTDGLRWGPYDPSHPYGPWGNLLKLPGGLYEFPLDQFMELGFYRFDALLKFREDAQDYVENKLLWCDSCTDRAFRLPVHLENHRAAIHQEQRQGLANAKAMGAEMTRTMADIVQKLTTQSSGYDQQLMAQFFEQNAQMMAQNRMLLDALASKGKE